MLQLHDRVECKVSWCSCVVTVTVVRSIDAAVRAWYMLPPGCSDHRASRIKSVSPPHISQAESHADMRTVIAFSRAASVTIAHCSSSPISSSSYPPLAPPHHFSRCSVHTPHLSSPRTMSMLSSMSSFFQNLVKSDSSSDFYTLGVDIGTTSIKAVVTHSVASQAPAAVSAPQQHTPPPTFKHTILSHHSTDHLATLPTHSSSHSAIVSEQDTTKLLLSIQSVVRALPADHRRKVEYVGVSCAMHGVVLWHDRQAVPFSTALFQQSNSTPTFSSTPPHSNYIDWRDGRCTPAFLLQLNASLPHPSPVHPLISGRYLHTGYGIATLAHMAAHNSSFFSHYTRAGTIGDYFVWLLMNVRDDLSPASRSIAYPSYIHPTNAAAWGGFDIDKMQWETDRIASMRIPSSLLPTVMQSSPLFPLTPSMCHFLGVNPAAHTAVSVGDAQASVYAVQPTPRQLVLYIGTSAQVSLLVDEKDNEEMEAHGGGDGHDVEMEGGERQGEPSVAPHGGEMDRPEAYGELSISVAPFANARGEGEESVLEPAADSQSSLPRAFSVPSTNPLQRPVSPGAAPRLPTCEYRPYLTSEKLLVCASVTGGNALEWLARALQSLHTQLSSPSPLSPTALLQAQAPAPAFSYTLPASAASAVTPSSSSRHEHPLSYYYTILLRNGYHYMALPPAVRFHPTFFSERSSASSSPHAQLTFLSSHITALSPGSLASALSLGIVENLHLLLTASLGPLERDRLRRAEELVCVGGAVRRNGMLRVYAEKVFGKRAVVAAGVRVAATGAAGGSGGGSEGKPGRLEVEEEGSEDTSMYWPDAAFGVAVFGLQRLWEQRVKTLIANKAMHAL